MRGGGRITHYKISNLGLSVVKLEEGEIVARTNMVDSTYVRILTRKI